MIVLDVHWTGRRLVGQTLTGQVLAGVVACGFDDYCDGRATVAETLTSTGIDPDGIYQIELVDRGTPAVCSRIRAVRVGSTS